MSGGSIEIELHESGRLARSGSCSKTQAMTPLSGVLDELRSSAQWLGADQRRVFNIQRTRDLD
jgi:hypothetical protein